MSAKSMRKIIEDLCEIKEAGSECRPEYNAHSSLSVKSMRKIIEELCEMNVLGARQGTMRTAAHCAREIIEAW